MNEPPQKQLGKDDFSKIPNGAPGIETRLMLLWDGGVRAGTHRRAPLRRDRRRRTRRRCSACGRARARSRSGSDGDIVIWDPNKEVTLSAKTHHMRVDYNPYEGRVVTGAPAMVLSRGEVIVDHGAVQGRAAAAASSSSASPARRSWHLGRIRSAGTSPRQESMTPQHPTASRRSATGSTDNPGRDRSRPLGRRLQSRAAANGPREWHSPTPPSSMRQSRPQATPRANVGTNVAGGTVANPVRFSRARRAPQARPRRDPDARARQGAVRRDSAKSPAGWRSSSSPAAFRNS